MDTLNDYYPLYGPNPYSDTGSDSEKEIPVIDANTQEDWETWYSDELWYLWSIIQEHVTINNLEFFNKINFIEFKSMVYKNTHVFQR